MNGKGWEPRARLRSLDFPCGGERKQRAAKPAASREAALQGRIAELEAQLAESKAAARKLLAVLLRPLEAKPSRSANRRDYMREFMRRKRAAQR
jgi:hypothetical protein